MPKPGSGQVLIRVTASPVNPSDLHFLEGQYAFRKSLPTVPGLEGCGRVVAVGDGLLARRLAGKRVAFAPATCSATNPSRVSTSLHGWPRSRCPSWGRSAGGQISQI